MDNSISTKPNCIHVDDIATVAAHGVQRALAARHSLAELTMEEADQVGGGALLLKYGPIIYGGIFSQILKQSQLTVPVTVPVLNQTAF